MMQTALVTVVAVVALATIVRRFSTSWLPAAFRPTRRASACDGCALVKASQNADVSAPARRPVS